MNQLYVGIDVSSRNNVTYVMKPDGSKHSEFSVANNLPGAKELSFRVCQALDELQLDSVIAKARSITHVNSCFIPTYLIICCKSKENN